MRSCVYHVFHKVVRSLIMCRAVSQCRRPDCSRHALHLHCHLLPRLSGQLSRWTEGTSLSCVLQHVSKVLPSHVPRPFHHWGYDSLNSKQPVSRAKDWVVMLTTEYSLANSHQSLSASNFNILCNVSDPRYLLLAIIQFLNTQSTIHQPWTKGYQSVLCVVTYHQGHA